MKASMTDKAKLYVVKNDEGEYWDFSRSKWSTNADGDFTCCLTNANAAAYSYHGHVVALVEVQKPEVVSQKEAEILKEALKDDNYGAGLISDYVDEYWDDYGSLNRTHVQDRLMRAYVNGWTVEKEKEKKYNVKVPHTKEAWYYQYGDTDLLTICPADKELRGKFTESEIEHYGLQDCEKEEVTEDEQ